MIIVGLEGCTDCHLYHNLHPEYRYIELQKKQTGKSDKEILQIKKVIAENKELFKYQFPILLEDDLTPNKTRKELVKELRNHE